MSLNTFRASVKNLLDGLDAHLATLPPNTVFEVAPFKEVVVYGAPSARQRRKARRAS